VIVLKVTFGRGFLSKKTLIIGIKAKMPGAKSDVSEANAKIHTIFGNAKHN
jgi:hypothetical protein